MNSEVKTCSVNYRIRIYICVDTKMNYMVIQLYYDNYVY